MDYKQALDYLYDRLPVFHFSGADAYKPGLQNTIKLMDALDHPYKKYKTIHVAGTNGKGSVSHLLSAIFQSAGYKVGLYTSPHLVDFGERIKVNGKMIEQQYVINFVENNKELFETIQPSFFEATMSMAFCYFEIQNVDVAIIEVGLGGRLDSTNIIHPELSVITNISFDHVEFLGDTIPKIAAEKAGIIKHNVPVVIGETHIESADVFKDFAFKNKAAIYFADQEIKISNVGYSNNIMTVECDNISYKIGLTGSYQIKNFVTVFKSIELLKEVFKKIHPENIIDGVENVISYTGLTGRWQCFGNNPQIFMDTAHNFAGVNELITHLKYQKFNKLHMIFGMVKDKDISNVLKLLPQEANYYFTNANINRALPANELKIQAEKYGLNGTDYLNVEMALNQAIKAANAEDLVLVFGSNFVVGEAIEAINKKANH